MALKLVFDQVVENEDDAEEIDHHHVTDENDRDQNHENGVQVASVVNVDHQEIAIATEANRGIEVTVICVGVTHVARVAMSEVQEAMFGDLDMTFEDLELTSGKLKYYSFIDLKIIFKVKKMIEKCEEVDRNNHLLRNVFCRLLKIN